MQTPVKLIVFCLIGMLIPNAAIASVPSTKLFTDVPESLPNAPYIYELVEKQILDGTGAQLFTPEGSLTREQFAKILSTAFQLKIKDNAYKLPFTDIHNEWSKPYIATVYNEKLMDGVSADLFAPTEPITRQAAALIVWRWLQDSGVTNHSIAKFQGSVEDTDSWAKEAVSMVLQNGLRTEGLSKEPYHSKEIMTRGDAAALIALSLKLAEAHNQHAAKDKQNFQLDQPKRKELPPSGSGISLEQAKYYETSETARVTNTITWYRLDCETLHSLIFQTTGIERIEIRDAQGKYVSAHTSNQTSSSFIFEPKQTGFYYLEIKADPSKQAEFKAVNGASASKAIDYNIMDQIGASLQLPANQEVYFAFPMTNGSDYMIEAALNNGNLEKMTILNQKGDLLEDRQGINFIALKPTQTETYLLKVRSADQPVTYKLKVQEKGVTKETAISIGSGIREVAITHTGVTWLNLTFPRDKNYDFKVENVTTYDLSLQGIDRLFGQTIFTSERDPSFQ
ncbi:S-layer homology domain-containing protein [Paenibacillus radicis (ex Xue et al. 2023)]|uniref:S-layer homology domain-containing protein n=1 Tax=Paenibacillus radicis (ex Xue et al. 2023) TaxID=2972489 RepID=A0ABT1YB12_9BACL|nr:S-layer homology domain-containing protein [Paenibacillus radicis (ex Xue et al. 2023)]MCR8630385.1 S-layer homology domain-containing protein [Paenibacillus radicis (ex Xue et al. 2023)]